MQLVKKIEAFGEQEAREAFGHFLIVTGVLGIMAYLLPYTSTAGMRFGFASGIGALWTGIWLLSYRLPHITFAILPIVIGASIWVAKYAAAA